MTTPSAASLICPVLIGRSDAVASLAAAVECLHAGAGGVVLLAGEAGIGKTRLVAEVRRLAQTAGLPVLQGNCFEYDRSLPYAAWLDLLRSALKPLPKEHVARDLGFTLPDLAKLLPELLDGTSEEAPATAPDGEQEKRRLFQAIDAAVTALSRGRPAVLVLEDLHWSDDTSLELLLFLARQASSRPLLLVGTYRLDEVGPALGHALATLDRLRVSEELKLERLSLGEVQTMVHATLRQGHAVRADVLHVVYSLTEGNPFFVEEVLRSLPASAQTRLADVPVPRSVHDAVQRRLGALSAAARESLRLAAVIGQRFDFPLLQRLTVTGEDELLPQVRELVGAGLVAEAAPDEFSFRHALTRQAVYSGLLTRERRVLHARTMAAILELHGDANDTVVGDLAYHAFEAGDWSRALEFAARAGERALSLYAPGAAIEQFNRAEAAATAMGTAGPPALFRGRALALQALGDFESALANFETARDRARVAGEPSLEWQCLIDLALLWAERDYARSGELAREALALARTQGDAGRIAHSLNRVGNWHTNVDQPQQALRHHQEALATFEALGDAAGVASALDLLGIASLLGADLVGAVKYYERALALFRERGNLSGQAGVLALLLQRGGAYEFSSVVPAAARLADGSRDAEEALRLALATGQRSAEAFAHLCIANWLGPQGELARALEHASKGLTIARETEHRQWLTFASLQIGRVLTDCLALDEARAWLEDAHRLAHELGSSYWIWNAGGGLAIACMVSGDLVRAQAILNEDLAPATPMLTAGQRQAWLAACELALARGEAERALHITEDLRQSATNMAPGVVVPSLALLAGRALAALGRVEKAAASLTDAAAVAEQQGALLMALQAATALAHLHHEHGDADATLQAVRRAEGLVQLVAAHVPDERRDEFLRRTAATLPKSRRRGHGATGSAEMLTPREREVAALVATGCSNRAIAETLVLGERTIDTHVSNILSKLGFASRAQIAAWAVEQGLRAAPS